MFVVSRDTEKKTQIIQISSVMSNIKLLLVVFFSYLVLNAKAQFKIIGLLNVDQSNDVTNASFGHQTNAQGRGFSVTNGLRRVKPISSVPNNIIKVRIIEDQSGAELTNLSAKDVQQISGMVLGTTRTANKSISKINGISLSFFCFFFFYFLL